MVKRKRKAKRTQDKTKKKQVSGLLKILELVVIVGTLAGVLIKFFRGAKKSK